MNVKLYELLTSYVYSLGGFTFLSRAMPSRRSGKYDEEWDDITAAMSWIATGLGLTDEEVFNYDPTTDY